MYQSEFNCYGPLDRKMNSNIFFNKFCHFQYGVLHNRKISTMRILALLIQSDSYPDMLWIFTRICDTSLSFQIDFICHQKERRSLATVEWIAASKHAIFLHAICIGGWNTTSIRVRPGPSQVIQGIWGVQETSATGDSVNNYNGGWWVEITFGTSLGLQYSLLFI